MTARRVIAGPFAFGNAGGIRGAMHHLVLASASPRRRELLERIGVTIEVRPADIDESIRAGEAPIAYAARLADEKAHAVRGAAAESDAWVLAADTIVELDGEVLGKA